MSNNESNFRTYICQTRSPNNTQTRLSPIKRFSDETMCHFSQLYIIAKSLPFPFWTLVQKKTAPWRFHLELLDVWQPFSHFSNSLNNKSNSWLVKALTETEHTVVMCLISSGPLQSPPPFNPTINSTYVTMLNHSGTCFLRQAYSFFKDYFMKVLLSLFIYLFWIGQHEKTDSLKLGDERGGKHTTKGG